MYHNAVYSYTAYPFIVQLTWPVEFPIELENAVVLKLTKSVNGGPRGRVVKVADFSALDHSIISPMWVRASHGARIHM